MQHYVKKKISELRPFGIFLRVLQFPPPIKLTSKVSRSPPIHDYRYGILVPQITNWFCPHPLLIIGFVKRVT